MRTGCAAIILFWPCLVWAQVAFTDVTASSGITFRHENGASERKYIIETMGSGGAWLDFDGDGNLDLFLVNGGSTPARKLAEPVRHALYQNLGNGRFRDVSEGSGLDSPKTYGMGAAAGDFDNDGRTDLFLSGYPQSHLYRNEGGGRFRNVTAGAGVANPGRLATSSGWFDYDRDGDLDLLVANYLTWSWDTDVRCGEPGRGMRQYCHPDNYDGIPPTLYRNNGDGTFTDATKEAGLDNPDCKGLGVVLADFDGDGWPDIFIANDGVANAFYWNRGDGTFEEASLPSGVAYSEDGLAEAGMGTDAGDVWRDGTLSLYVTHLEYQWNRLYRYLGKRRFADVTAGSGLTRGRNLFSGFGTRFLDYDGDGWLDLLVVNGHILDNIQKVSPEIEYAEPKLMLRNRGGGRFEDTSAKLGPAFLQKSVGRAALVADYDNDGDPDFAITNNGQPASLLRNDGGNRHAWLAIQLKGTKSNRDGIGARVTLRAGELRWMDERKGGTSYLGSGDPRLYFGLGGTEQIEELTVRWPSGTVQTLGPLRTRQLIRLEEPSSTNR